jgi:predicted RNA-binding Zn ribbon-like protein
MAKEEYKFDFDGDLLALDFLNTVSGMRGTAATERINGFAALVSWARQVGLIDKAAAAKLAKEAERHPAQAAAQLARALQLREALFATIAAALAHRAPPAEALAALNSWIAEAQGNRRLHPTGAGRFEARFEDDGAPLAFLRPLALDVQTLLERELKTQRVRLCDESEVGRCGWFFLDQTKNASRRFCSMTDCGNRAKQRRFQERRRKDKS